MSWIKREEAFKYISQQLPDYNLDDKILDNWAKKGGEIKLIKEKNRIGFKSEDIESWVVRLKSSLITLGREDYLKCFTFAVESYYNPITKADFNRAKQRDVGEFLTNQTQGKLGEIALEKLASKYEVGIQLDFNVTGQIPSQDIDKVSTRNKVWNNPAIKVSIKTTKLKNILLAVPENEVLLDDRRSDMYVLSQVGLFPNHILRIIKTEGISILKSVDNYIPAFDNIPCRIGGWILLKDLKAGGLLTGDKIYKKYGIQMASPNYIKVTGDLSVNWEKMLKLIIGN